MLTLADSHLCVHTTSAVDRTNTHHPKTPNPKTLPPLNTLNWGTPQTQKNIRQERNGKQPKQNKKPKIKRKNASYSHYRNKVSSTSKKGRLQMNGNPQKRQTGSHILQLVPWSNRA